MNIKHLKTFMLCAFAAASIALVSCGSDDPETTAEIKPAVANPTGFVVMSYPNEVVNGDTATILVRINPSAAKFTKDQMTIDCVASDIYTYEPEVRPNTNSRSTISYVKNSSNFTLLDIVPDTLNNDTLQGQWRVSVLVKSDQNIFDKSVLALVASYKDAEGKTVNVSSDAFQMTLVPTPGDGVTAWTPRSYTDSVAFEAGELTPYYWLVQENTYKNASGMQMRYEIDKRIRSTHFALGTIDNDSTTTALTKVTSMNNWHVYSYRPIGTKVPFSDLIAGNITNYHAQSFFTLEDKTGHEAVITDNCDYGRFGKVYCDVDCPEQLHRGEEYTVNLDEALKDYGFSTENIAYFASHPLTESAKLMSTNYHGVGVVVQYVVSDDCKTMTIKVLADCEADKAFTTLQGAFVKLSLRHLTEETTIANYVIKLKRKGA